MAEMDPKLRSIVEQAMSVLPHEIGCDDCFEYLAAYADHMINGSAVPPQLRLVGDHLERCSSCVEEMNYLLEALRSR